MDIETAVKYYKTEAALAEALGLKSGTIAVWRHRGGIPAGVQFELQILTGGRLKADPRPRRAAG